MGFSRLLLGIVLVLFCHSLHAQERILKMSGHEYEGTNLTLSDFEISLDIKKRNGKTKTIVMPRSDVFAVYRDGEEELIYSQDSFIGDDFTIDEMRIYIAGEQDAIMGYDPDPTKYVGMLLGAGVGIASEGGLILPLSFPAVYTVVQLIPRIKIREETISNSENKYNEIYAMGYESVARSRKVIGGLKGSAIGVTVGTIFYFLIPS